MRQIAPLANWKLSQTLRRSHQKLRKHLILPALSELLPAQGFLLGAAEDAGPIQETDYYYCATESMDQRKYPSHTLG